MASSSRDRNRSSQGPAGLNRPRHVPNVYERRKEFSNDDPPSFRPEGYESPYNITKEGDRIQIWWEGNDEFFEGTVRNIRGDGKRRVEYDDGEVMYHLLSREVYTLIDAALERVLADRFGPDERRHMSKTTPVYYPRLADYLEVGHRVKIYRHEMKKWYLGLAISKDERGRFRIAFDNSDKQWLRMKDETFRFIEESATVVHTLLIEECLGE